MRWLDRNVPRGRRGGTRWPSTPSTSTQRFRSVGSELAGERPPGRRGRQCHREGGAKRTTRRTPRIRTGTLKLMTMASRKCRSVRPGRRFVFVDDDGPCLCSVLGDMLGAGLVADIPKGRGGGGTPIDLRRNRRCVVHGRPAPSQDTPRPDPPRAPSRPTNAPPRPHRSLACS